PSFIPEFLQKNGQDRRNDHCCHQDHRQDGGNDFAFLRIKHSHFFHLISCCPQEDRFFHCGRCGTGDLSCHSRIILPFHQKTPQCGLSSAPDVLSGKTIPLSHMVSGLRRMKAFSSGFLSDKGRTPFFRQPPPQRSPASHEETPEGSHSAVSWNGKAPHSLFSHKIFPDLHRKRKHPPRIPSASLRYIGTVHYYNTLPPYFPPFSALKFLHRKSSGWKALHKAPDSCR